MWTASLLVAQRGHGGPRRGGRLALPCLEEVGGVNTLAEDMDSPAVAPEGLKIETNPARSPIPRRPATVGAFFKQRLLELGRCMPVEAPLGLLWLVWLAGFAYDVALPGLLSGLAAPIVDFVNPYAVCAFASSWLAQHFMASSDVSSEHHLPHRLVFYAVFYVQRSGAAVAIDRARMELVARSFPPAILLSALMHAVL